MLPVLIRSAASNEYPQHTFSSRNKKKNIDIFCLKKVPYQDHNVPGSNSAEGGILVMTVWCFIA